MRPNTRRLHGSCFNHEHDLRLRVCRIPTVQRCYVERTLIGRYSPRGYDMKACNCYVATLNEEARFCLRYGAHDTDCPVYRVSLDPVDRENDKEFRQRVQTDRVFIAGLRA